MCTYETRMVHLQVLASMWTPKERLYLSDHNITGGGFRMDFPWATGAYAFPSLTNNLEAHGSMNI